MQNLVQLNHRLTFFFALLVWSTSSAQSNELDKRYRTQVDSVLRSSSLKLSEYERSAQVNKMVDHWKEYVKRTNVEHSIRLSRAFLIFPNHDTDLDQADLSRENGEIDVQALQNERTALEAVANDNTTDWRQLSKRSERFIADAKGRISAFTNTQYAHASLLYVLLRSAPNSETNTAVLKSAKVLSHAGYLDPLLRRRAFERLSSSGHGSDAYFTTEHRRIERLITRNLGETKRQIDKLSAQQDAAENLWLQEIQRLRDNTIQANEAINRANRVTKR